MFPTIIFQNPWKAGGKNLETQIFNTKTPKKENIFWLLSKSLVKPCFADF